MKKTIILLLLILNIILFIPVKANEKKLILNDKVIIIDPGHGSKDIGTSYNDIKEKDINLSISMYLANYLEKYGAIVYMTRTNDYDLSTPNTNTRKRSDFNNRIKYINEIKPELVISIHQNYYKDSKYSGTQVFYKGNEELAKYLQKNINESRLSKPISNTLYMYNKLDSDVLLIECGFLSNDMDRKNLSNINYQKKYAKKLSTIIANFYKNK